MAEAEGPPSSPAQARAQPLPQGLSLRASLYVGDLHPDTTEEELLEAFGKMGAVEGVHICRDTVSAKSLGYAYVNFFTRSDAARAVACLNHTKIKGKHMRIMWSHRDSHSRKTGIGNLFVKNLDPSVTGARLQGIFCSYGTILSCKVSEENGKSKGFGFVQFDSEDSAIAALNALNDTMLEGKKLYVAKFVKKSERNGANGENTFTNLYVKNLCKDMTEDLLREKFSEFGKVRGAVIMKDQMGKSRGFGFVNFEMPEEARMAVEALNGAPFGSKNLFVGRAQKKTEREELLKREHKQQLSYSGTKSVASNLYVKNLDVSVNDETLKEHFSAYGQVTSAKVMSDENGMSKGFGFVSFSSPEEAKMAMDSLNGSNFQGRFIYVAIAQRKEDRRRLLHSYYTYPTQPASSSNCGVFPIRYRPPHYALPACPPSNFVSYMSAYQPGFYPHLGRTWGGLYPFPPQSFQQTFPTYVYQAQQGNSSDRVHNQYHSTTHTTSQIPTRNLNRGKNGPQSFTVRKQRNNRSGPAAASSGGSATARSPTPAYSPASCKNDLGELLYPLVENIQPESAGKITGMLLKTKKSDILKLINSPNSLAAEVGKAVQVLRESNTRSAGHTATALPSVRCLH